MPQPPEVRSTSASSCSCARTHETTSSSSIPSRDNDRAARCSMLADTVSSSSVVDSDKLRCAGPVATITGVFQTMTPLVSMSCVHVPFVTTGAVRVAETTSSSSDADSEADTSTSTAMLTVSSASIVDSDRLRSFDTITGPPQAIIESSKNVLCSQSFIIRSS